MSDCANIRQACRMKCYLLMCSGFASAASHSAWRCSFVSGFPQRRRRTYGEAAATPLLMQRPGERSCWIELIPDHTYLQVSSLLWLMYIIPDHVHCHKRLETCGVALMHFGSRHVQLGWPAGEATLLFLLFADPPALHWGLEWLSRVSILVRWRR